MTIDLKRDVSGWTWRRACFQSCGFSGDGRPSSDSLSLLSWCGSGGREPCSWWRRYVRRAVPLCHPGRASCAGLSLRASSGSASRLAGPK